MAIHEQSALTGERQRAPHAQVNVVVAAKPLGWTWVIPYSHDQGLQFWIERGVRTTRPVIYQVPCYEIRIAGAGTYKAVRFGLTNKGQMPPPASRRCDAGLAAGHICTASWVPGYMPHSFVGSARPGAWRLLPGQGFYIHEGGDVRRGMVGGSLGCVQILDGRWNSFLGEIEKLAGAKCYDIGKAGNLKVKIEPAAFPTATLVTASTA